MYNYTHTNDFLFLLLLGKMREQEAALASYIKLLSYKLCYLRYRIVFYMIIYTIYQGQLNNRFFLAHVLNKSTTTMQVIIKYKHASESFDPLDLDLSICHIYHLNSSIIAS